MTKGLGLYHRVIVQELSGDAVTHYLVQTMSVLMRHSSLGVCITQGFGGLQGFAAQDLDFVSRQYTESRRSFLRLEASD